MACPLTAAVRSGTGDRPHLTKCDGSTKLLDLYPLITFNDQSGKVVTLDNLGEPSEVKVECREEELSELEKFSDYAILGGKDLSVPV